jgi:hypothetical protein
MAKKKNLWHQITDPWTTGAGLEQTGKDLTQLLPGNPFGKNPAAPAFGIGRGTDPGTPASTTDTSPSGDTLLNQVLANYSEFMKANNIAPQEVIAALGGEGNVAKYKNQTDIQNALNQLGAQTNWQYKIGHPQQINSPQFQQLLGTITGYQKPYLDAMKAQTGLASSLGGEFAQYLSPRSRAAYGDLSKAYTNEANTLANVIPAENPAAILNMIGGGTGAAPASTNSFLSALGATPGTAIPGLTATGTVTPKPPGT